MSKREDAIEALMADANSEYGWLSDAQGAVNGVDETYGTVFFAGEGSIDVGHAVSIMLHAIGEDV